MSVNFFGDIRRYRNQGLQGKGHLYEALSQRTSELCPSRDTCCTARTRSSARLSHQFPENVRISRKATSTGTANATYMSTKAMNASQYGPIARGCKLFRACREPYWVSWSSEGPIASCSLSLLSESFCSMPRYHGSGSKGNHTTGKTGNGNVSCSLGTNRKDHGTKTRILKN